MAHAPFAPSSAKRWLACTAAYGASLHLPDPPDSEYAAEGTRLHDMAARILQRQPVEELTAAESHFLTPYTAHCFHLMNQPRCWFQIEKTLRHSPLLFGTPDFLALVGDTLHVVDLKTGAGVMVDPTENDQAMAYAYMALAGLFAGTLDAVLWDVDTPTKIVLTIVQPPDEAKPVKSWETTAEHVWAWGKRSEDIMASTIAGDLHEYVPGEHCRWCKAKPVCPKLRGVMTALPASLDVAELGALATAEVLDRADLVLQFIDAVRAHGHDLATRGIDVPGWTLKPKRATRSWADEDKVLEIARRRKIKIWQDKLMSPAMAEKAHPNMPAELTEQIVSISSGTNLVRGNPPVTVALPEGAPKMARLMANLETLKYRK